jgi:hypothetical protein
MTVEVLEKLSSVACGVFAIETVTPGERSVGATAAAPQITDRYEWHT